jgi:hypothetical protein
MDLWTALRSRLQLGWPWHLPRVLAWDLVSAHIYRLVDEGQQHGVEWVDLTDFSFRIVKRRLWLVGMALGKNVCPH